MFTEITATLTLNSQCSITAKVFDIMDSSDPAKVRDMQNIVKNMLGVSSMSQVQQYPRIEHQTPQSSEKLISEKQLTTIRKLMKESNISEAEFCNLHAIQSLEKMPMDEARSTISEMLGKK